MKGHVQSKRRAWTGGLEPGFVAAYTSVGVGIGVGVDALITHHKVIYERPVARPASAIRSALALVLTMAATPPAWAQADAQAATGKSVRVLSSDGSRQSGRLVSLTAADVTINRNGQDQRLALSGVQRVERVSHHVRNFLLGGLAAGFAVAVALCAQDDNFCGDDGFAGPALVFSGIGLGGGGGLGLVVKSATADSRVLYRSPGTTAVSVAPFGARGGMGLGMRVRW